MSLCLNSYIKTALITGGTRGIGLGIAKTLAENNYNLILCGVRSSDQVENTLEMLRELRKNFSSENQQISDSKEKGIIYVQADISSSEHRLKLVETSEKYFGCINILVNNAGVAPKVRKDILEASEESFEYVLKINLQGPYFLTQMIAKKMIEEKQKNPDFFAEIINISSVSATTASPSRGEYCISKAGIAMATKLWAVRLAEFNIPVYEIRPGIIATDMTSGVKEKYDKLIEEGLLLQKRWGTPEDIGKAVLALAENFFPYSTGQVINSDGGFSVERL